MKLNELADILGAELTGSGDVEIRGAESVRTAGEGQITYIIGIGKNYLDDLRRSRASAALAPPDTPEAHMPLLRVKNPRLAFARVLELFYVKPYSPTGISDRAVIGKNVQLGADCSIHPYAVIADDARIGSRVTLYPGAFIGRGSVVDDDSVIHANVSIAHGISVGKRVIIHSGAVIGSDGFGFVTDAGKHHKIPQTGGVIIGDDVEIGANSTIDRATLGNTIIGKGTKIDNLVQVAHNVSIGEYCILAGHVGIAGSSTLGSYVVLGGRAGVADHISVGDKVMAGGGAGITRDVNAGDVVAGHPALPIREWLKVQAVVPKLPELKRSLASLEKQVGELRERIAELTKGEKT
ncbi:MAG TPA: UDP-3-O-(3-hydroxymyristoyl)glucosamine N-acyltransferase [Nitrospirota bacterium]